MVLLSRTLKFETLEVRQHGEQIAEVGNLQGIDFSHHRLSRTFLQSVEIADLPGFDLGHTPHVGTRDPGRANALCRGFLRRIWPL